MQPAKRTLAIVALTTTLVGCSSQALPATTPTMPTEPLRIYATTATLPLVIDLTTAYNQTYPLTGFDTRHGNYQLMVDWLLKGEMPYFLSNHTDGNLWAAPIGQDGIAIIVHPSVEIADLSMEQLRLIYQGRLTRWIEVGGSDTEIVVFSREDGSGTRIEFERMVMGRRQTTRNALVASSNTNMVERIAQQEGSIGYISMSYLNESIHTLMIDGVALTSTNIYNNLYPLRSTLFVVGLTEPEGEYRVFIDWVQRLPGQAVVARHYTPLIAE